MWNDFFYYTRSERRIICLLLFLFVLLGGIGTFLFWRNGQAEMPVCHEMAIDSFLQQVQDYEEKRVYRAKPSYRKESAVTVVLQPFDPNTADSLQLRSLGIPGNVVRNILRYRAKGGGISFRGVFCPDLWIGFGTFSTVEVLFTPPSTRNSPQGRRLICSKRYACSHEIAGRKCCRTEYG